MVPFFCLIKKASLLLIAILLVIPCILLGQDTTPPKLVLQITIDQLRGDLPFRFEKNFGEGGFKMLMDSGIWYTNAHHPHYVTETVVGHTTLATGTYPSEHGLVSNNWYDKNAGKFVYAVRDENYPVLIPAGSEQQEDVGSSPQHILAQTLSDQVKASNGDAKVFSVSLKDRAAIAMGGRHGKAFWYSASSGKFISTTYYYDAYPRWVNDFNSENPANQYHQRKWDLLFSEEKYVNKKRSPQELRNIDSVAQFNRTFPHNFGDSTGTYFYPLLRISPVGDSLTAAFAKALIVHEQLGKDQITDYLSISFSSTDYVGHMFGPNSLEMEDQLMRLDGILAGLFNFINQQVGLHQTLVVLASDHGVSDCAYERLQRDEEASAFYFDRIIPTVDSESQLMNTLGAGTGQLVSVYFYPFIYLNHDFIKERNYSVQEVTAAIASSLSTLPGVQKAIPVAQIFSGNAAGIAHFEQIKRNVHPSRAGDIFIAINDKAVLKNFRGTECANHGSPFEHDTHVPVVFLVNGKKHTVERRVSTIDIVPTMCELLGIDLPDKASGSVLHEVVE